MNLPVLTLNAADVKHLRTDATVILHDSEHQPVDVSMHQREQHQNPLLILDEADLMLAARPVGFICGAEGRATTWTVRVEGS